MEELKVGMMEELDCLTSEQRVEVLNDLILHHKTLNKAEKGFTKKILGSGAISDQWHTFDDLYYHRMILTLVILESYPEKAWKSKQHHDGTMFDDSFIVGVNTPEGQYSYHYDLENWDLFTRIKEVEKAPEYDGHKPEDIKRLLSLLSI